MWAALTWLYGDGVGSGGPSPAAPGQSWAADRWPAAAAAAPPASTGPASPRSAAR